MLVWSHLTRQRESSGVNLWSCTEGDNQRPAYELWIRFLQAQIQYFPGALSVSRVDQQVCYKHLSGPNNILTIDDPFQRWRGADKSPTFSKL